METAAWCARLGRERAERLHVAKAADRARRLLGAEDIYRWVGRLAAEIAQAARTAATGQRGRRCNRDPLRRRGVSLSHIDLNRALLRQGPLAAVRTDIQRHARGLLVGPRTYAADLEPKQLLQVGFWLRRFEAAPPSLPSFAQLFVATLQRSGVGYVSPVAVALSDQLLVQFGAWCGRLTPEDVRQSSSVTWRRLRPPGDLQQREQDVRQHTEDDQNGDGHRRVEVVVDGLGQQPKERPVDNVP